MLSNYSVKLTQVQLTHPANKDKDVPSTLNPTQTLPSMKNLLFNLIGKYKAQQQTPPPSNW